MWLKDYTTEIFSSYRFILFWYINHIWNCKPILDGKFGMLEWQCRSLRLPGFISIIFLWKIEQTHWHSGKSIWYWIFWMVFSFNNSNSIFCQECKTKKMYIFDAWYSARPITQQFSAVMEINNNHFPKRSKFPHTTP